MKDMIEMILKHTFQLWVKNNTMAHIKLGEPLIKGCTSYE